MEYLFIKTIGIDFTIKCVEILSGSVQSVYSLISTIKAGKTHIEISKVLRELDLENDIMMIDSLLRDINIKKCHTKTLALCLDNLKDCVLTIESELKTINDRITYNNSLWIVKSFRSYTFDDKTENLRLLKLNLDNRKKNLFEVLKITNFLNENSYDENINNKILEEEIELLN